MMKKDKTGSRGEDLACAHLIAEGYGIIARNWRMDNLEIDVIAANAKNIIFVEVKTRIDPEDDPFEAITPAKIRNMVRAADVFLDINNYPQTVRFDIIAVKGSEKDGTLRVEHIPDAFDPPIF